MANESKQKETTDSAITQDSAETQTNETLADLSIKDLLALRSIIDLASQRGAFKPAEMVSVGQNYEKLDTFLNIVIEQQQREEKAKTTS